MKTSGQGKRFILRRILVALALAISVAAPSTSLRAAAGHSCGWQTGCKADPVVCVDKESGKEVPCTPAQEKGDSEDFCIDPATGQVVHCGWQTGFAQAN
jgi:hypothetical protein